MLKAIWNFKIVLEILKTLRYLEFFFPNFESSTTLPNISQIFMALWYFEIIHEILKTLLYFKIFTQILKALRYFETLVSIQKQRRLESTTKPLL